MSTCSHIQSEHLAKEGSSKDLMNISNNQEVWWNQRSDLNMWRLKVLEGRQTWHYCEEDSEFSTFICRKVSFRTTYSERYGINETFR